MRSFTLPERLARTTFSKRNLRFSRANVFARDAYSCQYCGRSGTVPELTYDHALPRRSPYCV